jgi:hypothetical protein
MKVYIYCLFDENDIPLYVGKTKNSLTLREYQHQKRLNRLVKIFELDYVESNNWKYWEEYWIEQFKVWGFDLLNQNKGGGGVSNHSEESRLKMKLIPRPNTSFKLKGIKRPDVSKRLSGVKLSKETCDKISKSKINHICYKNPKRTEKILESNKHNYELNSNRNKKISSKLLGRKAEWMKQRSKNIIQYNKQMIFIKEWKSAFEAGASLNKQSSAISECCNGKRKSAYGYIWKFK